MATDELVKVCSIELNTKYIVLLLLFIFLKDENPLKNYTAGDVVKARILEFRKYSSPE